MKEEKWENKILIVIDMQEDFVRGALGTEESKLIIPTIRSKINTYNENLNMVWATQDTHQKNYLETQEGRHLPISHCIQDTDGWRIINELNDGDSIDDVIFKNSFGSKELIKRINDHSYTVGEIDSIELVGVCTDICVISNALVIKTFFPEMKIIVDQDCCAGTTRENHKAALKVMEMCHIDII